MNVNSEYRKLLQSAAIKSHVPIIAHSRAFTDSRRRMNARLLSASVPGPQAVGGLREDPPWGSALRSGSPRARGLRGSGSEAPALPRAAPRSASSADSFSLHLIHPISPLLSVLCLTPLPLSPVSLSTSPFSRFSLTSFGPTPPPLTPGGHEGTPRRNAVRRKRPAPLRPVGISERFSSAVISQRCGPSGGGSGAASAPGMLSASREAAVPSVLLLLPPAAFR